MKNSKASKAPKEKRKKQSTLFDVTKPPVTVTKKKAKRRRQIVWGEETREGDDCGG